MKSKQSRTRIDLIFFLTAVLFEKVGVMCKALSISRARFGVCVLETRAMGIERLTQALIIEETSGYKA